MLSTDPDVRQAVTSLSQAHDTDFVCALIHALTQSKYKQLHNNGDCSLLAMYRSNSRHFNAGYLI